MLLKKQNVEDALTVAKNTHQRFPDDVEGLGVLATCLRANGQLNDSLEFLNRAISLDANYAQAYVNRGLIWLSLEEKTKARLDLEKAYEIKPHIKQIWDLLIGLIVETKNYSRAISILIKMIELDPKYEKNFSLLSLCNQEAGDPELAIISFEKILAVSALINLGDFG